MANIFLTTKYFQVIYFIFSALFCSILTWQLVSSQLLLSLFIVIALPASTEFSAAIS